MHSPLDQVVGIDHASRIFAASRHPKSFISLDSADHLLTDVADANYASAMVAAWASRFLPPLMADLPQVEAAEGVVATETLEGTFQLKVRSGEHTRLPMSQYLSVASEPDFLPTNWYLPASQPAR